MDEELRASILERLQRYRQAVTYGALAGVVGGPARTVMSDLPHNHRNSWVVNKKTKLPTDYEPDDIDPNLIPSIKKHGILTTRDDLEEWLPSHK